MFEYADRAPTPAGRADAVALGNDLRALLTAFTLTTAAPDALRRAAEMVRAARAELVEAPREAVTSSPYDIPQSCGRAFAVGHGPANPLSPPLQYAWEGEQVYATCSLDIYYEGPRGHAHGGISAMLLDDALARVPELLGHGRVTRSLEITYLRPVPLHSNLVISASVTERDGTRVLVRGTLALATAPTEALVEAIATFVLLRDDQLIRINPAWQPGMRWPD